MVACDRLGGIRGGGRGLSGKLKSRRVRGALSTVVYFPKIGLPRCSEFELKRPALETFNTWRVAGVEELRAKVYIPDFCSNCAIN